MIVNRIRQVQELEKNNINILKFCPLFHLLSEEFISKLYMIQICGNFDLLVFSFFFFAIFKDNVIYSFAFITGKTLDGVLLMTTDLMMYGLGNNRDGQLGIGHMSTTLQPVLIGILNGKKIKKLIYLPTPVVFALTEEGQVSTCFSHVFTFFYKFIYIIMVA